MGLPMLNNFVGEYLVLQGAAQADFAWAVVAALGVILSACYMLWLYQRVFLGAAPETVAAHVYDVRARERAAMLPLIVLMVWMGTFTQSFLPPISAASRSILEKTRVNQEFHAQLLRGVARAR
jgi:NADH-quinone oxidoreductase subunit M